ncbi:MAG: tetratricopeptide (TPR) repeat protein [Myxococcota bacterium]
MSMRTSLVVLLLLVGTGCGRAPVVRASELLWTASVDLDRQLADKCVDSGELTIAERMLRRSLARPDAAVDEVVRIALRQDLHFALGRVLLLQGRFSRASAEASRGLALGGQNTVFQANLYGLRAMAVEADGRPLDALDDYSRALTIHKSLFDAALAAREST